MVSCAIEGSRSGEVRRRQIAARYIAVNVTALEEGPVFGMGDHVELIVKNGLPDLDSDLPWPYGRDMQV